MIVLSGMRLVVLLVSVALIAVAMICIARPVRRSRGVRQRSPWIAGLLGFGSGACLGAVATWGRGPRALALSAVVLGLLMGTVTAGIALQVTKLTAAGRRAHGQSDPPKAVDELED